MKRFYLAALAPVLLSSLLFSTAANALLVKPLFSRIEFNNNKCLLASEPFVIGKNLTTVDCDADPMNPLTRFVFEGRTGPIKLSSNQDFCIDVPEGVVGKALVMDTCTPNNANQMFTADLQRWSQYVWVAWGSGGGGVWIAPGENGQVIVGQLTDKSVGRKVKPIIQLIEMDGSNVCMQVTANPNDGNPEESRSVQKAKCDVTNVNQHFIFHSNGFIELADGTSYSGNNKYGYCFTVSTGQAIAGKIILAYDCGRAPNEQSSQKFSHPYTNNPNKNDRILYSYSLVHDSGPMVLGFKTGDTQIAIYPDDQDDYTQTWRPSLGESQVIVKLAAEDKNLCLDTSGDPLKAQPCKLNTNTECQLHPEDPNMDLTQSFVLREGDSSAVTLYDDLSSVTLAFADSSSSSWCVDVEVDGPGMNGFGCHFQTNQTFNIDWVNRRIILALSEVDKVKVLTLKGSEQTAGSTIKTSIWEGSGTVDQKWDVLPGRVPKCGRLCIWDGGDGSYPTARTSDEDACSTGVCVQGLCGPEDDFHHEKAICCGRNGIDNNCLNARASRDDDGDGIVTGNWCMSCAEHTPTGTLKGCSTPTHTFALVPDAATHIRCSYDNLADTNLVRFSDSQVVRTDLKYLALTGSMIGTDPLKLSTVFPNLVHLDLAGSSVNGYLFSVDAARVWSQLEYANVSECTNLGANDNNGLSGVLFHTALSDMSSSLRVLDMSSMALALPSRLSPIAQLTSLEELYLNGNQLGTLPENFFRDLVKLTKLRMANNPMKEKLPGYIYTRNSAALDSDVGPNETPSDTLTLTPTKSPMTPRPSSAPTKDPTKAPTVPTTMSPTFAPTKDPTTTAESKRTIEPTAKSAAAEEDNVPIIVGSVVGVIALILAAVVLIQMKKIRTLKSVPVEEGANPVTSASPGMLKKNSEFLL